MLVLHSEPNRRVRLYVGDKLIGEVVNVGDHRAKLGFEFGPEVRIVRDDAKVKEVKQHTEDVR